MPNPTVADRRAWRADNLDPPHSWRYPLSNRLLDALIRAVTELRQKPDHVTELPALALADGSLADDLVPVRDALDNGRGFAIVEGIPTERYSALEQQTFYWLIGRLLGRPVAQNVQGTLLYDVRDTGQDVRSGVRFSVTNAESTFHVDGSFNDEPLDYVGLLCLRPARSGGVNQLVSAYTLHQELAARHPETLPVLNRPFHFDRRGGLRPGDGPTAHFPVLQWRGRELTVRYLRYWMEVGHEKAGEPLTTEQVRALDALDSVVADRSLRAEFALRLGDALFVNNRWILHNRTAFVDYPEPERRRHLVRLWLMKREGLGTGG
jgi:alpha-ketoglutarate-dependent taurine dioxygenase